MASSNFYICGLILCASLLIPTGCHVHVALFIFGDSLYDSGNNNYINTTTDVQANYWPYGITFFNYPTGRFSDGRLLPDFIAEYANLPLIPPYLQPGNHQFTDGANFASAGAGALVETNYQSSVIDLHTQLSNFEKVEKLLRQKLGAAGADKVLAGAVYLINIGSNDYISRVFTTNTSILSYTEKEYVQLVIGNLTTVIKEIYEKGGRKFGIPGLGPTGCIPVLKVLAGSTGDCFEQVTELANLHNRALSKALKNLESQLKGFKYSLFDTNTTFSERMNNPSKYGFKEGEIACCGSGPYRGDNSCGGKGSVKEYELCENASEYVFFDSGHPTERANQQLAQQFWSGTPNVTGPHNLKSLFGHTQV